MLYPNLIIDNIYQIIDELGQGGMGVVYLAYHLRLQKYVVLKRLKKDFGDISLVRNEVDILKGLHHRYLPQVYDIISYEGDIYTVIDYIDGYDLDYYVKNGYVFDENQLIKWLLQMCEVLSYLHENNPMILHTDIKPGNIMVTRDGDICLIDFGVSLFGETVVKGYSSAFSSPEQFLNVQYIRSNLPQYMALDERTDIYSTGACFYYLMTGVLPSVHKDQTVPLSQMNTGYSESFVQIIETCMADEPDNRYRTAGIVSEAIHNMYKLDSRYKIYVIIQTAASIIGAIFIVLGALLIFSGYNSGVNSLFENKYSEFIEYKDSGNAYTAESTGLELINDPQYSSYMDNSRKAEILHGIGDCYYDQEDYSASSSYYKEALNYAESTESGALYYRDYAFSLINEGKIDEAKEIQKQLASKYPDSSESILTQAEILYIGGDYNEALELLKASMSKFQDTNSKYTAYIIQGDSNYRLKDYPLASSAYKNAVEIKENISSLRKLGTSYLMYGSTQQNSSIYRDAENTFGIIIDRYSYSKEDLINYTMSCLLSSDTSSYEKCKSLLKDYVVDNKDCRIYICLGVICYLTNDSSASDYFEHAHSTYSSMSSEEMNTLSADFMEQVKTLYKKCTGRSW